MAPDDPGSPSPSWGEIPRMLDAADRDAARAAEALLAELSDAELTSMLGGGRGWLEEARAAVTGSYNSVPYPAAAIERLGFVGVRFTDGPRGVVVGHSTALPSSMARGATFDPALEERLGEIIGREATAQGANLFAGICINLLRHPAWGRAQETYGEDPVLLGAMGAALTRSVGRHMATCVKHFALNSMENSRFWVDVRIDEADLCDIYLPHFKRCVDAGVDSVMTAYNKVNGEWAGHHRELLTTVLKQRWGFEGFVMSDFGLGVRDMVEALHGGQDLEMPMTARARKLPSAIADGRVDRQGVRDAARRIVTSMFRAAKRSGAPSPPASVVGCDDHRALARTAATGSFVLLTNAEVGTARALPLFAPDAGGDESPLSVALVGKLAGVANTGDHGSSNVRSRHVVTIAEGLRAATTGRAVRLAESLDDDVASAQRLAAESDAAVVVVGNTWHDEGEYVGIYGGDRRSLSLRPSHERLIEAVAAACPRTIVVLVGGSAFVCERWRHQVGAILMTWYSGDEGGNAIADVLLGHSAPGGRLPCTWPASEAQLPPYRRWTRAITYGPLHGYRLFHHTGRRPAFWFGEGLSYTNFDWADPVLSAETGDRAGTVTVTVEVHNAGARSGAEVVQAYLDVALGSHPGPLPTLVGFGRVELDPGDSDAVRIELDADLCARALRQPGSGRIRIGRSAGPADLIDCGSLRDLGLPVPAE